MKNDIQTLNVERLEVYNTENGPRNVSKLMFFSVENEEFKYIFFITPEGEVMVDYGNCPEKFVKETLPMLNDIIIETYKNYLEN